MSERDETLTAEDWKQKGDDFFHGTEIDPPNLPFAAACYSTAHDMGHVDATWMLYHCRVFGLGVKKDPAGGRDLVPLGLERKHPRFLSIAAAEQLFNSTPPDFANVVRLCKDAAEQSDVLGQALLGYCYMVGVPPLSKDLSQARKWLAKADDQGFLEPPLPLLQSSIDDDSLFEKAVHFLVTAQLSRDGLPDSQYILAVTYKRHGLNSKAKELCEKAALRGHKEAQQWLAKLEETDKSDAESETAKSVALSLFDSSMNAEQWKKQGDALFHETTEWTQAFGCYLVAHEMGCLDATWMVMQCYAHGLGVEKNDSRMHDLFKVGLSQGHARFQSRHAVQFTSGGFSSKADNANFGFIEEALTKAVDQGDVFGQAVMGLKHSGHGNSSEAARWLELADSHGLTDEPYSLQRRVNPIQALWCVLNILYVRLEAEDGIPQAQYELADRYETDGLIEIAEEWYGKAAHRGHIEAHEGLQRMGDMINEGIRHKIKGDKFFRSTSDLASAVERYTAASEMGNSDAMRMLGMCYSKGYGVTKDVDQAINCYERGANAGHARCQWVRGNQCFANEPLEPEEGVRWYRKAAEQGDLLSQARLAIMYAFGEHPLLVDRPQADYWLQKVDEHQVPDLSSWPSPSDFRMSDWIDNKEMLLTCYEGFRSYVFAEDGDLESQHQLGDGAMVMGNRRAAAYYFEKAARRGHREAQTSLATIQSAEVAKTEETSENEELGFFGSIGKAIKSSVKSALYYECGACEVGHLKTIRKRTVDSKVEHRMRTQETVHRNTAYQMVGTSVRQAMVPVTFVLIIKDLRCDKCGYEQTDGGTWIEQ